MLLELPAALVLACPTPPVTPAVTPAVTREEVVFPGHGGLELSGTLLLPEERPEAGAPALLLVAGSGPTDRDGNQRPYLVTDLLKTLAEEATAAGFVTLCYDKRATPGHAVRILSLPLQEQNEFLSWESFVGDVKAAWAFLAAHGATDPTRVAVLGHSEGGLYALQAAADLGAEGPAALVLASTASTPLGEILHDQIALRLRAAPAEQRTAFLEGLDRAVALVVDERRVPDDLPPGLAPLFPPNALDLLSVELAADPRLLAASYAGPVLVLAAQHDVQVPAEPHAAAFGEVLAGREGDRHRVVVVPGASHNFKPVSSPREPGFLGEVVPLAVEALRSWLAETL